MNQENIEKISIVKALPDALIKLSKKHKNLVVLHPEFGARLCLKNFSLGFPDRYFNFGLAEKNTVSASIGFSIRGKIPYVVGYGNFALKALEQIRSSVCYPNLNIKFVAVNTGLNNAEDGVGYQATEDIGIMRALPNMKVVSPADYYEAVSALEESYEIFGSVYIRLANFEAPAVFNENYKFEFGKAKVLHEGEDIFFLTHGAMLENVLEAYEILKKEGIKCRIVDMASIKPVDEKCVLEIFDNSKVCAVVEDNNCAGGLYSAVCEILQGSGNKTKVFSISLNDKFAESGNVKDLYKKFGLDSESIVLKAKEFLQKVNS